MNRPTAFHWLLLCVWGTWACAFSGYLAQFGWLGSAAPDLGIALMVALAARTTPHEIAWVAVCLGISRASVSVDPPAALLAASLVGGALLRGARSMVPIESPPLTAGLAFALTLGQGVWLQFVQLQRAATAGAGEVGLDLPIGAALTTALAAVLVGGFCLRLPGLSRLAGRKTWVVGASSR